MTQKKKRQSPAHSGRKSPLRLRCRNLRPGKASARCCGADPLPQEQVRQ
nr:MAG TPA: hypothetical protein [Caudoviricetes sp.]